MTFSKPKPKPKRFNRLKFLKRRPPLPPIKPLILRKHKFGNYKRFVIGAKRIYAFKPRKRKRIIDYKNLILLRKFVTPEGRIIPKRITNLTSKQQRCMARAVKIARIAGFVPFLRVAKE